MGLVFDVGDSVLLQRQQRGLLSHSAIKYVLSLCSWMVFRFGDNSNLGKAIDLCYALATYIFVHIDAVTASGQNNECNFLESIESEIDKRSFRCSTTCREISNACVYFGKDQIFSRAGRCSRSSRD